MKGADMTTLTKRTSVGYTDAVMKMLSQTYVGMAILLGTTGVASLLATTVFAEVMKENLLAFLIVSIIGMFGALFATLATRNKAQGFLWANAMAMFMGLMVAPVLTQTLNAYTNGANLIAMSAFGAASIVVGLSAYVFYAKKDFSYLGSSLGILLWTIIIAGVLNMFFQLSMLSTILAGVGILVFSGYVLYDTSRILNGEETNWIMASTSMYLNFMNLFLDLLRVLSALGGDSD